MIKDTKRAIVFAAHPDDAEISAGGTIAKLANAGADVVVVNVTTSEYSAEAGRARQAAAASAAEVLGHRLRWADHGEHKQVEDLPEYRLVKFIDEVVETERPDLVIGPWIGDSHTDHARLARAVRASSRRWDADLLAYCPAEYRTPCFQRFAPNVFVDISPYLEKKLEAIGKYSYSGQGFRALNAENLTRIVAYYGALNGYEYAEGFELLRCRID